MKKWLLWILGWVSGALGIVLGGVSAPTYPALVPGGTWPLSIAMILGGLTSFLVLTSLGDILDRLERDPR